MSPHLLTFGKHYAFGMVSEPTFCTFVGLRRIPCSLACCSIFCWRTSNRCRRAVSPSVLHLRLRLSKLCREAETRCRQPIRDLTTLCSPPCGRGSRSLIRNPVDNFQVEVGSACRSGFPRSRE